MTQMREGFQFTCARCSGTQYESEQIRVSGGGISAFFDMQNKRYATVTCTNCGFTELYKGEVSGLNKVLDLFGG